MSDSTWWLSFTDPDRPSGEQFLGVAVIDADDLAAAVTVSWLQNCNPGGEIEAIEIPTEYASRMQDTPRDKLLSRAELQALGHV